MIPPRIPISMVCIPSIMPCPDVLKFSALASSPLNVNMKFIPRFININPTNPEYDATPLFLFESPNGIAIANNTGKYVNAKLPTVVIPSKIAYTISFVKIGNLSIIAVEVNELPIPNKIPKNANNDTGNINVFPNSWKKPKVLVFNELPCFFSIISS